jgi:hypothetical protein
MKQVTLVIQMYGFAEEKQSVKLVHTGGRKHHSTKGLHNDQPTQPLKIISDLKILLETDTNILYITDQ